VWTRVRRHTARAVGQDDAGTRGAMQGDLTRLKFSIANATKDMGYYRRLAETTLEAAS